MRIPLAVLLVLWIGVKLLLRPSGSGNLDPLILGMQTLLAGIGLVFFLAALHYAFRARTLDWRCAACPWRVDRAFLSACERRALRNKRAAALFAAVVLLILLGSYVGYGLARGWWSDSRKGLIPTLSRDQRPFLSSICRRHSAGTRFTGWM
ncbi:MAG: hypothetical protein HY720_05075 [Planctomycetes bacterium]|nr:hypothetical protein [Planctomycetota bacterium]